MKTLNLTQIHAGNYPINHRIQGFLFRDLENKVRRSRCYFFQFSRPILDFKHFFDAEMSLDGEEVKRFIYCGF